MKRQKTLLSPGGWTALLLLLALGLWEATAAAGQQAKGQRQGQQQSK